MFNFVRRWLFNRNRFIFVYWNGQKIVKGDPMVFWRSLQQHEDYREDDFKLIQVEGLRNKIFGKLSGVVRDVFGIKTAEEGGLTELECLDILRSYIEYSGFQKKKWRGDSDLAINYGAGILARADGRTEHERRFGIYLNMERAQVWQSKAIAQGVGVMFGSVDKSFFEQLYENQALINRCVSVSKQRGSNGK